MTSNIPTAQEITKSLCDDFRRDHEFYGGANEIVDPFLEVLFRTFGHELEDLYRQTDGIRLSLLDELTSSLGIEPRRARPAQTVLRFFPTQSWQVIPGGAALTGPNQEGLQIPFTTDEAVAISQARVAMAFVYQDGTLQLMSNVGLPEDITRDRPVFTPVPAALGRNPAIYIAIDNLDSGHLSQHGLFFQIDREQSEIIQALSSEPWCLADPQGEMSAGGVLRPRRGNAGLRKLEWLVWGAASDTESSDPAGVHVSLPDGYYSNRCFLLPEFPDWRQFTCPMPWGMESSLEQIFPRGYANIFSRARAWFRIGFPLQTPPLAPAVHNILLNCVTASNVEMFNQTVDFASLGHSIPVSSEAGTDRFLVAPKAVLGELGAAYLPRFHPSADRGTGRFWFQNGRIELQPAIHPDGETDSYANVRLWLCDGETANRVADGAITSFPAGAVIDGLRVVNYTPCRGGAVGEGYQKAKLRFAAALLSRDRIVTAADLEASIRAFDHRVRFVQPGQWRLERQAGGLHRVLPVVIGLDTEDFTVAGTEATMLLEELKDYLERRMLQGSEVSLQWQQA